MFINHVLLLALPTCIEYAQRSGVTNKFMFYSCSLAKRCQTGAKDSIPKLEAAKEITVQGNCSRGLDSQHETCHTIVKKFAEEVHIVCR